MSHDPVSLDIALQRVQDGHFVDELFHDYLVLG